MYLDGYQILHNGVSARRDLGTCICILYLECAFTWKSMAVTLADICCAWGNGYLSWCSWLGMYDGTFINSNTVVMRGIPFLLYCHTVLWSMLSITLDMTYICAMNPRSWIEPLSMTRTNRNGMLKYFPYDTPTLDTTNSWYFIMFEFYTSIDYAQSRGCHERTIFDSPSNHTRTSDSRLNLWASVSNTSAKWKTVIFLCIGLLESFRESSCMVPLRPKRGIETLSEARFTPLPLLPYLTYLEWRWFTFCEEF